MKEKDKREVNSNNNASPGHCGKEKNGDKNWDKDSEIKSSYRLYKAYGWC
jgi:hypothetical protein